MCLGAFVAGAQRSHTIDSLLVLGIDGALRHQYERARVAFEQAAQMAPEDPAGVVLMAGLLHQSAEDLGAPFDRRAFDSLLTHAEVRATSVFAAGYADRHIWKATLRGMLSVVESRSDQWMAAIRDALASASEARASLEQQGTLADAGLPIGNYLYWRSRKTEALQWLPFIADNRVEGIRLLEWCATEGHYHRWAAVSSLIWVLHDAGNLGRAEYWARTGLASYPENRTYLAGLAKVLESRGAYAEAASAWARIAEALRRDPEARPYAIFSASVNQVRCWSLAGDRDAARSMLASLVPPRPEEVPKEFLPRLQAKVREWEELTSILGSGAPSRTAAPGGR
jgi:hypothetical protein